MNTSGYDRELFDYILSKENEDIEAYEKLLKWRGFLVQRQADRILLSAGSPLKDVSWLKRTGIRLRPLSDQPRFSYEVDISSVSEKALFEIFSFAGVNGMTGPYDFCGRINSSFATFKRCSFGVKVPAYYLDPGIALLVKVMPLIGCHTVMSCDGHLSKPPVIHFFNEHHLKWASVVLSSLHSSRTSFWAPPPMCRTAERGWLSYCWQVTDRAIEHDLGRRYGTYQSIQSLCYQIMDGDFSERVRAKKKELIDL